VGELYGRRGSPATGAKGRGRWRRSTGTDGVANGARELCLRLRGGAAGLGRRSVGKFRRLWIKLDMGEWQGVGEDGGEAKGARI
jgi:hypothetical protein